MEKLEATIEKALVQLVTRCGEIAIQRTATEDSMHPHHLQMTAGGPQCQLIGQLRKMT